MTPMTPIAPKDLAERLDRYVRTETFPLAIRMLEPGEAPPPKAKSPTKDLFVEVARSPRSSGSSPSSRRGIRRSIESFGPAAAPEPSFSVRHEIDVRPRRRLDRLFSGPEDPCAGPPAEKGDFPIDADPRPFAKPHDRGPVHLEELAQALFARLSHVTR